MWVFQRTYNVERTVTTDLYKSPKQPWIPFLEMVRLERDNLLPTLQQESGFLKKNNSFELSQNNHKKSYALLLSMAT